MGMGDCTFTNRAPLPSMVCGRVEVSRQGEGTKTASAAICSGMLWPKSSSAAVTFGVAGMNEACSLGFSKPWDKVCGFAFVPD